MLKAFMIASLTMFSAVAAFASEGNADVSVSSSTNDDVVVDSSVEQSEGSDSLDR